MFLEHLHHSSDPAILGALADEMAATPQDPLHHGEGDVAVHTRMVLDALKSLPEFQALSRNEQDILLLTALFHDSGKPRTTRLEDDRWKSPGHSAAGAQIAQATLYKHGYDKATRDTVYGLILYHQTPFWLVDKDNLEMLMAKMSHSCPLNLLFIHAKADALGRLCQDHQTLLTQIDLAIMMAEEMGCLNTPYQFANAQSRVEYFTKDNRYIDYESQPASGSEVTVMAGLPGSGKDTFLKTYPHPVISLDDIRDTMDIGWKDNQGQVIQAAREQARVYLRTQEPFAWNATNLTRRVRDPLLGLLRDYDASITIAWIETPYTTLMTRNKGRGIPIDRLITIQEPAFPLNFHHSEVIHNG